MFRRVVLVWHVTLRVLQRWEPSSTTGKTPWIQRASRATVITSMEVSMVSRALILSVLDPLTSNSTSTEELEQSFVFSLPVWRGDLWHTECGAHQRRKNKNVEQIVEFNSVTIIKDLSLLSNNTTLASVWGRFVAMLTKVCHVWCSFHLARVSGLFSYMVSLIVHYDSHTEESICT